MTSYISFGNFIYIGDLGEPVLGDNFLYSFEGSNTQSFALPYPLTLIVSFLLAKQALRMFSQRMSGQTFFLLELRKMGKVPNAKIGSFVVSTFNEEKV